MGTSRAVAAQKTYIQRGLRDRTLRPLSNLSNIARFNMASFLRVDGTNIVGANDNEVILRGAGLGGWMTWVNDFRFFVLMKAGVFG